MNRTVNIIIPVLIALLTIWMWAMLNRPSVEPPWPTRVHGFSFAPMRADDDPQQDRFPSVVHIDEDLALLKGEAYAVRTYTLEDNLIQIPTLAKAHGLDVNLGVWLGNDRKDNEAELARLDRVLAQEHKNIVRLMVGNEVILRDDLPLHELIGHLDRIREQTDIPVSTAEPWHVWLTHPQLASHVDFITVHLLPYWEKIPVDEAVAYCFNRLAEVKAAFPTKEVIIGEVGWPSNGRTNGGAEASQANQSRFLRRFLAEAQDQGLAYYIMEAFDQPWKMDVEGAIGAYWGIYDANRQPKFTYTEPVVRIPSWRELAALSVGMAVLLLTFLYRDSSTLSSSGKGFLALVTYAISTAAVWLVYEYTRQYMTPATTAVGVLLLIGGVGVVVLVFAEAHEWAESLWLKRWRRAFPRRRLPDEWLPRVSIHVPAYNEPPDLLIETLDALAVLDYPSFEVLVIDNNTKDPAVWEPVRDHCERLNADGLGRFRFYHVDPLAGFKAGALNFALRETDPKAAIVAVIDADYIVQPRWLRDLVPAFSEPDVAIVQAPQDYRDGHQNAFKAMCLAEYRGFFHIGMVTRNERNAIIQHGTMTMIRRDTLADGGGWAEWCITEDAELGLRIFEEGLKALYIPVTYGRGLMPDTFADFKKQRFRWAYGAVRILGHHRRELLGLRRSGLTAGQRWHFVAGWVPWFADGVNLVFNLAALGWTVAMVLFPLYITPPYMSIALVPLVLFVFKMAKTFFLYRLRVDATLRQSLAAGIAGLALSHTIARAVLAASVSGKLGFVRTPKLVSAPAPIRAIADAREEVLLMIAFLLGGLAVLTRHDAYMIDVKVWSAVLLVQAVPYAASLLVSLISALPGLPARLVGPLEEMRDGAWEPDSAEPKSPQIVRAGRSQTPRRALLRAGAAEPGAPVNPGAARTCAPHGRRPGPAAGLGTPTSPPAPLRGRGHRPRRRGSS